MSYKSFVVLTAFIPLLLSPAAYGVGDVHGHASFEKVKGRPDLGYYELYEYKAFLCKDGNTSNCYAYHCGDPGTAIHIYTGCYIFEDVPAGTYSLMTSFGKFFPRGKVTSSVIVSDNQQTESHSTEPVDYSGFYSKSQWDGTASSIIFQTFVATGTSVSRVCFAKADATSGGNIEFSIHDGSGGGNVENWPQIGPTRSTARGGYGDHWVSWQAGEVPIVPGRTYAIKLRDPSGTGFQPYWCDDSYYANGTGYRGSQSNPANHDYYIAVFADNDNTSATILPRSTGLNNLAGWKDAWAQSYTARGTSFAGSALFGTDGNWEFTSTCSVHANSPNGPQMGPTKTIPSVYGVSTAGVAGVCFSRGEVPTTPGNTYWIVYQVTGGFNPYRTDEGNTYAGGTSSFLQGTSWINTSNDLYMSLYEYTEPPETGDNLLVNGGAETGDFTGWITGGSPSGQPVINPSTHIPNPANHSGNYRFGLSVGWATANCYQYQVLVVDPGHTYEASFATSHMDGTDEHVRMSWIDGTWPGPEYTLYDIGPSGSGTTWSEHSGQTFTPSGSTVTIVVRYLHDYATNIASIHVDDLEVRDITAPPAATNTPTATSTPVPPTSTPTPVPTPVTVDDYFTSASQFDADWTAYGSSPQRFIKNEFWCTHSAQYVEIQSSNGGYYRIFDQGWAGGDYTLTMDTVRGYSTRYIRVDSNGGTNPNVYDNSWTNAGGNWVCEYPTAITGTVGASGNITVFLGTTNNGQYEHLRIVFDPPEGPLPTDTPTPVPTDTPTPVPTNTPTNTFTPTNTPTNTFTPTNTPTNTFTPTNTPTNTFTPTNTPTNTFTPTNTPTNTFTPTNTPTNTFTPTPTNTPTPSTYVAENFNSMPSWSSQWNAGWGSAATWTIAGGGQSGNHLRAVRASGGSSAKVKVYNVPANKNIVISIYMRCPSMGGTYWMESGYRLGNHSAQDFDENSGAWTLIKKFDSSANGNGDVWTKYTKTLNTGSNTQISIGYKLGSWGTSTDDVGWDTLRIKDQ